MKNIAFLTMALCLCAITACSADKEEPAANPEAKAQQQSDVQAGPITEGSLMKDVSYVMGYQVSKSNKAYGIVLNTDLTIEGFATGLAGKEPKFSQEEASKMREAFMKDFEKLRSEGGKEEYKGDVTFPSYYAGYQIGFNMNSIGADGFDLESIRQGLDAGVSDAEPVFDEKAVKDIMEKFETHMQEKAKAEAEAAKKAGLDFLAENAKKEGVVTTASGLQYEVLTMGEGKKPTADDTVEVNYRGTLLDGTEFDSSYKRGETATFPLKRVVKGWTEGVQLMPVGSKFRFYVPSDLAYGDQGAGADIPGGSTLIFDIELISIKASPAENKKAGAAFLEENRKKEGVNTTDSGLQYEILTLGEGAKPSAKDTVEVNYRGTLLDGTEFDSSYKRNTTAKFPLNGVIKGWTEGLQLMPVGSKFRFYIPSDLAYGDQGSGAKIPGGSTLIFEVELLNVEKK